MINRPRTGTLILVGRSLLLLVTCGGGLALGLLLVIRGVAAYLDGPFGLLVGAAAFAGYIYVFGRWVTRPIGRSLFFTWARRWRKDH